ncbi:MAG: hypothetical protein AB1458_07395 [Bacteroidota bacterium]
MKRTMRITAIIGLTACLFPVFFTGCKKGEGDPFISFKSRKSRLTGEWMLSSGTMVDKSTNGSNTTTITTTYDGANLTETTVVNSGSPMTVSYAHTEKWVFEKDGSYTITVTDSNVTTTMKGKWDFGQGIGKETKKKEQLVLYLESYSSGTYSITYTGTANTDVYDIYQLKNKEIILKRDGTATFGSQTEELTTELTFKQ